MGPSSYIQSAVDRNVVMRRMSVRSLSTTYSLTSPLENKEDNIVYVQRFIVAPYRNHCCHVVVTIPSLIDVGVDVAVSNMNVFCVATGMQQCLPFALLSYHKIFRTAVNNTE